MSSYEVRRSNVDDEPAVLQLMGRALGWRDGDPNAELFRWKHRDSPFGASPAWVAVEDGQIIGFRTFMRWEFEESGRTVRAVRAVDTATHPQHQGRGIFKRLTLQAVDELRDEGVAFVFNTPNDQSRPGYLKMGWQIVGRLPVVFRPRNLRSALAMLTARTPAELMSLPNAPGLPVATAVDMDGVLGRGRGSTNPMGMRTRRPQEYWLWRYGLASLEYRWFTLPDSDEWLVYRLRRRGRAVEATVCEMTAGRPARSSRLIGHMLKAARADYAVALNALPGLYFRAPTSGPILTCLPLQGSCVDWGSASLTLGDIELF